MRNPDYTAKLLAAYSLILALAGPAGSARATQSGGGGHSSPQSCELGGYMWSYTTQSCADKSCTWFGGIFYPGESTGMKRPGGGTTFYWCDGLTGKMTPIPAKVSPSLPKLQPQGSLTFY